MLGARALVVLVVGALVLHVGAGEPVCAAADGEAEARRRIDEWLDHRWDPLPTAPLVKELARAGVDAGGVERLLRKGRLEVPSPPQPRGKLTGDIPLLCDHVVHDTKYLIYVPSAYRPDRAVPLVVAAHGGSNARDLEFGAKAALAGIQPFWTRQAEKDGFLLLAPLTDRGWNAAGNSILFSAISKVCREYRVDPDRIYITGHSMGGHLSWRCGILFPDRWGAIAPMSGGYDFVASEQVFNLFDVPGFATCGTDEPYGIRGHNEKVRDWMAPRKFPWVVKVLPGGHTIFPREIPEVAEFLIGHPRNLYRDRVYARGEAPYVYDFPDRDGPWKDTWRAGRGIPATVFHWVRLFAPAPGTQAEKAVQRVWAVNRGKNRIDLTAEGARRLRLYLHPAMVDFAAPVIVSANGKTVFSGRVAPDAGALLELVREFDDRGRIFHAFIDVDIPGDRRPPDPTCR